MISVIFFLIYFPLAVARIPAEVLHPHNAGNSKRHRTCFFTNKVEIPGHDQVNILRIAPSIGISDLGFDVIEDLFSRSEEPITNLSGW